MLTRRLLRSLTLVLVALVTQLTARVATATPPEIVIYAADVPNVAIHGTWTKVNESSAADGIVLSTADAAASQLDAPLATPNDFFEATFTPATNTSYKHIVWCTTSALAITDCRTASFQSCRPNPFLLG